MTLQEICSADSQLEPRNKVMAHGQRREIGDHSGPQNSYLTGFSFERRRDSNLRPSPWQGGVNVQVDAHKSFTCGCVRHFVHLIPPGRSVRYHGPKRPRAFFHQGDAADSNEPSIRSRASARPSRIRSSPNSNSAPYSHEGAQVAFGPWLGICLGTGSDVHGCGPPRDEAPRPYWGTQSGAAPQTGRPPNRGSYVGPDAHLCSGRLWKDNSARGMVGCDVFR
jgi:hypothetical protein